VNLFLQRQSASSQRGFTLIETILVIIILGIMAGVATQKMGSAISTAQSEQTKKELDQLAQAIVGNPETYALGSRADFGYVGDIGSLPTNLDALVTNPGGYTTWDGPYMESGIAPTDYKKDGWGSNYSYSGTTITSTGSGSTIDKLFASSSAILLANSISGIVTDANKTIPGSIYKDSIRILLTFPNGAGSTTTASTNPTNKGNFSFSNIPIGNRELRFIYTPATDTVSYPIAVYPGKTVKLEVTFPTDLF